MQHSFCKVKLIALLATVSFSSADNCQYAPGNWIGDGSLFTPDCPCYLKNLQFAIEYVSKISRKKSIELYYFPNFSASRCFVGFIYQ